MLYISIVMDKDIHNDLIIPQRTTVASIDPLLLRVTEAAELCRVGRSKAYELVASGEWVGIHVGRSVRVPLEELRAWVRRKVEQGRDDEGW